MADTRRTQAQLVQLFPDNTIGGIPAQASRDFVVTTFPNISASVPTVNDDANDGYNIGSFWVYTGTSPVTIYLCTNTTVGAAVWNNIIDIIKDLTPQLGGELDAQGHSIGFTQQTATGSGATTIDWKLGNKFKFTFGAQNETFTFTAPSKPCNLLLILIQDGTGSRLATFPTIKWQGAQAPTLSTGVNAEDIVSFYWSGDAYYGVTSLAFAVP